MLNPEEESSAIFKVFWRVDLPNMLSSCALMSSSMCCTSAFFRGLGLTLLDILLFAIDKNVWGDADGDVDVLLAESTRPSTWLTGVD